MFTRSRIAMQDADNPPGGQADLGLKPAEPVAAPADDAAVKLAAAEKRIAAAEKREAARLKKEQDAIEAKKIEDGKVSEVLSATQEKLAAATARLEAIEAAETARAERLFAALPEARQAVLGTVKDSVPAEKWAALLEAESTAMQAPTPAAAVGDDSKKLPPPTGAPMTESKRQGDKYTPTAAATEMLDGMMKTDEMLRQLTMKVETDDSGASVKKFSMSARQMVDTMKKQRGQKISLLAAAQRDHG